MAGQVAFVQITNEWQSLKDLIAQEVAGFDFDDALTYYIQCRGLGKAIIVETDSLPTEDYTGGILIDVIIKYEKDANNELYVKFLDYPSSLNISTAGA